MHVACLRVVLTDGRADQIETPSALTAASFRHQLLVGDAEMRRFFAGEDQISFRLIAPMALNAVLIKNRLHIRGIMNRSPARLLTGLRARHGRHPLKCHRNIHLTRLRRIARRLMTADTTSDFTWPIIHVGPLPLNLHEVLVQNLERNIPVSGNNKVRRTVFANRHDAVLHLESESGVLGDHGMLLIVFVAAPEAPRRPWPGHLLVDADILDCAPFHVFKPVINIRNDANGLILFGKRFIPRTCQHRRFHPLPQRHGHETADPPILVDQFRIAIAIQKVKLPVDLVLPAAALGVHADEELIL